MRQTALDSPYDRNQMQTLFAMLTDVRVQTPVAKPKAKPSKGSTPLFALWWQKLVAYRHAHSVSGKIPSSRNKVRQPRRLSTWQLNPGQLNLNPQSAASPLMPRKPARWRAPVSDGSAEFFALLDEMGARHQAAARRDHLISALEASITSRRLER